MHTESTQVINTKSNKTILLDETVNEHEVTQLSADFQLKLMIGICYSHWCRLIGLANTDASQIDRSTATYRSVHNNKNQLEINNP